MRRMLPRARALTDNRHRKMSYGMRPSGKCGEGPGDAEHGLTSTGTLGASIIKRANESGTDR